MKEKAKLAKKRLSSGYWERLKQDNLNSLLTSDMPNYQKVEIVENYKKIALQTDKSIEIDDEFLNKVQSVLDSEVEILNPIKLLLDEEDTSTMSVDERQRLILTTSQKFLDAKEFLLKKQK